MQIAGTFTTAAASGYMLLMPGEALRMTLTVGAGLTFSGRVVVERSRDGAQTWQRVAGLDYNGVTVAKTAGVVANERLVNESNGREFYRLRNITASGANGIGYVIMRDAPSAAVIDERDVEVTISPENIVGTAAGQLSHADGFELVAAPGPSFALELVWALLVYDYVTSYYGDGGQVTINYGAGGRPLTPYVAAADSIGQSADAVACFRPYVDPVDLILSNLGLNLVTSLPFTNAGTAAGVIRVRTRYRLHRLGLA